MIKFCLDLGCGWFRKKISITHFI